MGKKGGGGVRMKQMGPSKEQRAMMKQMQDMQSGGGMMNPLQDLMQMPPEIHLPPTPDKSMKIIWPMRKFFLKVCVCCVCVLLYSCLLERPVAPNCCDRPYGWVSVCLYGSCCV